MPPWPLREMVLRRICPCTSVSEESRVLATPSFGRFPHHLQSTFPFTNSAHAGKMGGKTRKQKQEHPHNPHPNAQSAKNPPPPPTPTPLWTYTDLGGRPGQ